MIKILKPYYERSFIRWSGVFVALLLHGVSIAVEPSPPDVLDFIIVDNVAAPGQVTLEAVLKPGIDSEAELEINDPGGATLKSGQKKKSFSLKRAGAESRERIEIDTANGKPRTVRAIVKLLAADGKPWMTITKEVKLNQPQAAATGDKRVPVVSTLPDGTKIVEYITSQEAVARGLPAEGKPAKVK